MKNLIFFISLFTLSVFADSQSNYSYGKWDVTLSSMPGARSGFSAVAYHDSIYVLGGFCNLASPENVSPVDVYVPATDTWVAGITEFPFPRGCPNACLIGDKIYAFGGSRISGGGDSFSAFDSLHIYDIQSNRWERGQCLPVELSYFAADTLNGKIYVAGGGGSGYSIFNTLYEYNPELDEWTEKASMSTSRWGTFARSWNGKLYVFGGYAGSGWTISRSIEVYDPETDEWTNLTPATTPRTSGAIFLLDGQLYITGGYHNPSATSYNHTKIISRYDIVTDTWFDFFHQGDDIPDGRRFPAHTMIDDTFYLLGGGGDEDIMNNIWSYSLKSIRQDLTLRDTVFSAENIETDLAYYFSTAPGEELSYSICPGYDEDMLCASVSGSILNIEKLTQEIGSTEIAVNVFNSKDTISSNYFTIDVPVGIRAFKERRFSVYPIPANNYLYVNISSQTEDHLDVYMVDLLGKKTMVGSFHLMNSNNTFSIDLDKFGLRTGMYMLQIQGKNKGYPFVRVMVSE